MEHPIHRVIAFEIVGEYTVRVDFEDGLSRIIDFRDLLRGELFGPLRDLGAFNAVRLDAESHTLVWPNGADFDPAILHDWPERESAMKALARNW